MENEGLLKLPETWCVVVDESNKSVIEKWFDTFYDNKNGIHHFEIVGISEPILDRPRVGNNVKHFGQEITFADFKRLVLGEKKEDEIIIVKTWETIYFKSEKATVELTLNHEKKTFDLQTAREEMVSFKSDTIEVARERLKCIESALDYAEKHLNK